MISLLKKFSQFYVYIFNVYIILENNMVILEKFRKILIIEENIHILLL